MLDASCGTNAAFENSITTDQLRVEQRFEQDPGAATAAGRTNFRATGVAGEPACPRAGRREVQLFGNPGRLDGS
jgi:hypothetical protein